MRRDAATWYRCRESAARTPRASRTRPRCRRSTCHPGKTVPVFPWPANPGTSYGVRSPSNGKISEIRTACATRSRRGGNARRRPVGHVRQTPFPRAGRVRGYRSRRTGSRTRRARPDDSTRTRFDGRPATRPDGGRRTDRGSAATRCHAGDRGSRSCGARSRVRLLDQHRLLIGRQPRVMPVPCSGERIELASHAIEPEETAVRTGAPVCDHAAACSHREGTPRAEWRVRDNAIGDLDRRAAERGLIRIVGLRDQDALVQRDQIPARRPPRWLPKPTPAGSRSNRVSPETAPRHRRPF